MVGAWDNEVICLRSSRVGRGGALKLTQHKIQLSRQIFGSISLRGYSRTVISRLNQVEYVKNFPCYQRGCKEPSVSYSARAEVGENRVSF